MLKAVFSPIKINQLTLKNRFVVPPMATNFADDRGEVTDRLVAYLDERAKGGFGLITLEGTAVHPSGLGSPRGLRLWDDRHMKGLSTLARTLHMHGAKVSVQLYHPGRQTLSALLGTQSISASPLPCPVMREVPREMNASQIAEMVRSFAAAAARVKEAGGDAVEIHGGHGYLLAQFTSPYSNRRTDGYGGDVQGRMRFALEVIAAVRRAVGAEFPLIYRISGRERVPGGLTLEETLPLARILAEAGVDCLHVSTGVYGSMRYIIPPFSLPCGLNIEDAAAIRRHAGVPVIAVGRIVDVEMAESIVAGGQADLVAMGRASIVDPQIPNKAAAGAFCGIRPCISCNQGCIGGIQGPDMEMSCLVNPLVGKERQAVLQEAPVKKKIVVAGGGPAGLEAARILALRGHHVVLCEKSDRLGGQFRIAALPPEKQPLARSIRWQAEQAQKAGVTIKMGQEVSRRLIMEMRPDAVIVATGGKPLMPRIPGLDRVKTVAAIDVLSGKASTGAKVLVMGGGSTGCETADYLLYLEKSVTVVEMLDNLARDTESTQRYFLLNRLKSLGAGLYTGMEIVQVLDDGVACSKGGEATELRGFDTLVAAFGTVPEASLVDQISGVVTEVHVIGDAKSARSAIEAIREAEELALSI